MNPLASPLTLFVQNLSKTQSPWTIPLIVLLFASLVRWAVSLFPYSGYDTPPFYGDFEAQRHWMEITTHLPIQQWYQYDRKWWGLDYPPLSAYHSWICGIIGGMVNPTWFALDSSRGITLLDHKVFMRAVALASDILVYMSAAIVFARLYSQSQHSVQRYTLMTLLLLQPGLIIIDHGHYQFNSVMLGLTLWAVNSFYERRYLLGAVFFCLSLSFKQMALYYAPAVFAFLLGRCFFEKQGWLLFIKLGLTVVTTFTIVFWPWLEKDELIHVIRCIFPVARGLYEDKVANVWCALNVVIKLRTVLDLQTALYLSLAVTTIAFLVPCINVARDPVPKRFLYTLLNTSLSFFLFSFQVHEKSILLPVLPVSLLVMEEPTAACMFINTAMFSMFPLLQFEGLTLPYYVCTFLWIWLLGGFEKNRDNSLAGFLRMGLQGIFVLWHIAESTIVPPAKLPHIFVVVNVIISCGVFCLLLFYFTYRQLTLTSPSQTKKQIIRKNE